MARKATERVAPSETIRYLLGKTNTSTYTLSKLMGKSPKWAWNSMGHKPRIDSLAKIAEVLGLKVAILGKDDEVVAVIEPEAEDGAS